MDATKRNKIIYWIATIWLALGMVSTGIVQLIKLEEEVEVINALGFPTYLLTILGVWKILGTIAVLLPKLPLLKEWAYAGFFFAMTGAAISHLIVGDEIITLFGPILLVALTIISWYFRPNSRKLIQN
ncbi:MAG: DoxX family protein [Galbibacter orientalis]|uniref:DoxX family protein n=1 Tax=Galbibacter orientalis TaxID=453852 RepID=UPI003003495B